MVTTRKKPPPVKGNVAKKRGRPPKAKAPNKRGTQVTHAQVSVASTCSSSLDVPEGTAVNSPPVKEISTGSKSPPSLQRRKKVKISNTTVPSAPEVLLEAVECHGNVFIAWLTRTGRKEGEGFYTKPIDDALQKTSTTNELYPHPLVTKDCPGDKSMQDLFAFHYYVPRRESRGKKQMKSNVCLNTYGQ